VYNITVEQGTDWNRTLVFFDGAIEDGVRKNLSGYNFYAQCRRDWDKDLLFDFYTGAGNLVSGEVDLGISGIFTTNLCRIGDFKWDLFGVNPDSQKIKFLKGDLTVNGSETKVP
jgi:hypothetical protein